MTDRSTKKCSIGYWKNLSITNLTVKAGLKKYPLPSKKRLNSNFCGNNSPKKFRSTKSCWKTTDREEHVVVVMQKLRQFEQ